MFPLYYLQSPLLSSPRLMLDLISQNCGDMIPYNFFLHITKILPSTGTIVALWIIIMLCEYFRLSVKLLSWLRKDWRWGVRFHEPLPTSSSSSSLIFQSGFKCKFWSRFIRLIFHIAYWEVGENFLFFQRKFLFKLKESSSNLT